MPARTICCLKGLQTAKGKVFNDNLPISSLPRKKAKQNGPKNIFVAFPTDLQHCVVQLCPGFIHPVDPRVQEEWVVADAREENLHHKGPVVEERDARGLEVHCEVRHVRLQLGKSLLALTPHVVL